jgi:Fe2+ transport system protein FeoA
MISLAEAVVGKTYKIISIPENNPCLNCVPCMRLRKMEIGLIPGEIITIENHTLGIWVIRIEGAGLSRFALRENEIDNVFIEEELNLYKNG